MLLLARFKWYLVGVLLVVSHLAVWHTAVKLTSAKYVQKQLDVAEAVIKTTAANQTTKDEIAKTVAEALAKWRPANVIINRKIQNELNKDPVYRDCKSNPDVMLNYQNKLDSQPE